MIQENISLKPYNTFAIDVKTRFFCEATHLSMLQEILTNPRWRDVPKLILGEGSNVLFTQDFPGLVIKMAIRGIKKIGEDSEHVWVTANAGENWHQMVLFCIENQYAGVENLSLIPGTVGAAPMQNIGAYGVELTSVFDHLSAIRIQDGSVHRFDHQACHFGYRDSVFKNIYKGQFIIHEVILRLNKKPTFHVEYGAVRNTLSEMGVTELSIKAISDAVIKIRREKLPDPKQIGNAGSFFKNPIVSASVFKTIQDKHPEIPFFVSDDHYKIPAAWLIEQCHWKGRRVGNIGVHQQHSLVLVNYGGGDGRAIKQLAKDIQDSVMEKFSIEILPEVNII